MADNQQRTTTSTQIRNMYSEGMSYMNIKFFNTNLSFCLYPFVSKDPTGRSNYDMKNGQQTTVNFEGAYAIFQVAQDIISGKIQEVNLPVPCAAGASIVLERKMGQSGKMETLFSISKNNTIVVFRFQTIDQQVKENGQVTVKTIESGLGAFMKTLDGYLQGINADRHLDKLTEDFAKSQEALRGANGGNPNGGGFQTGAGYNNNYRGNNNGGGGGYRKPYQNNGGGYKKPYQPGGGGYGGQFPQPPQAAPQAPVQQDMSSYTIPG